MRILHLVEALIFLCKVREWRRKVEWANRALASPSVIILRLDLEAILVPEEGPSFTRLTSWIPRVFQNTSIQWKHFPAYMYASRLDLPVVITLDKKRELRGNMNEAFRYICRRIRFNFSALFTSNDNILSKCPTLKAWKQNAREIFVFLNLPR